MPELKLLRQPARDIVVLGEDGQPVDLAALIDRRVKWAKRKGHKIVAMLAAPREGERGILLHFRNGDDYEDSVRRILAPEKSL